MFNFGVFSQAEESAAVIEAKRIMTTLSDSVSLTQDQMRAKVLEVAPNLSDEVLHELTDQLVRARVAEVSEIKQLFSEPTLARSFLAYQFVNAQDKAVKHIGGAVRSGLTTGQWLALQAGGVSVPKDTSLPEVAFFLFHKHGITFPASDLNAATLTPNRLENGSQQVQYLNEIDGFLVKYFVAHIVEMYLVQKNRQVRDQATGELLGYRAGYKINVALDVRKAIVENNLAAVSTIFTQSLERNHLSTKEFFDGKTREYIHTEFETLLVGKVPEVKESWTSVFKF